MDLRRFRKIFCISKGLAFEYHHHYRNYLTTKEFLSTHEVMTQELINRLTVYVATQKCVRTHIENMFIEYQYVLNTNIDKAINYQKLNKDLVPLKIQGEVIAKNILKLTGKVAKKYIADYVIEYNYYKKMFKQRNNIFYNRKPEIKFCVINPLRYIKEIKKI